MKQTISALLLMASFHTLASPAAWIKTWEQGATQYTLKAQNGAQLYIACNPESNAFTQYTTSDGRNTDSLQRDNDIGASINGGALILISDSFSDAGGQQFEFFWQQLRNAKSIRVEVAGLPATTFVPDISSRNKMPALNTSGCLTRQ